MREGQTLEWICGGEACVCLKIACTNRRGATRSVASVSRTRVRHAISDAYAALDGIHIGAAPARSRDGKPVTGAAYVNIMFAYCRRAGIRGTSAAAGRCRHFIPAVTFPLVRVARMNPRIWEALMRGWCWLLLASTCAVPVASR